MQNASTPAYANDSSPMRQMPMTAGSPVSPAPTFYTPAASPMPQQYMPSTPSYPMFQQPFTYYTGYQSQYAMPMTMSPGDDLATQFAPMNMLPVTPQMPTHELIPHRVFVGGFSPETVEEELRAHFEQFFHVAEVKVIRTPDGVSKCYGFLTFDSEEEANRESGKLEFKGRKLNVGQARRRISLRYPSEYMMASPAGAAPYPAFAYPSAYTPSPSPYSQQQYLYTQVEVSLPMQSATPSRSRGPSFATSPQ